MGTFQFNRNGRDLSKEEKKGIMDYLHANPDDQDAIPFLMKKYDCSETNIVILIAEEREEHWND